LITAHFSSAVGFFFSSSSSLTSGARDRILNEEESAMTYLYNVCYKVRKLFVHLDLFVVVCNVCNSVYLFMIEAHAFTLHHLGSIVSFIPYLDVVVKHSNT